MCHNLCLKYFFFCAMFPINKMTEYLVSELSRRRAPDNRRWFLQTLKHNLVQTRQNTTIPRSQKPASALQGLFASKPAQRPGVNIPDSRLTLMSTLFRKKRHHCARPGMRNVTQWCIHVWWSIDLAFMITKVDDSISFISESNKISFSKFYNNCALP